MKIDQKWTKNMLKINVFKLPLKFNKKCDAKNIRKINEK